MNEEHFSHEQDRLYKRVFAGISWPLTRPGYICIIAELIQPTEHLYNLLDEYEDFDYEQLISRAGALDYFYRPEKWLSGELDKATKKLLLEANKQPDHRLGSRKLKILPSRLKGLGDELFRYVYPRLKRMSGPEGELDISKGKLLLNYMSLPQDNEIATIGYGDFPAIESLAYAVMELEESGKAGQKRYDKVNNSYTRI
jgi:hypothetical protein